MFFIKEATDISQQGEELMTKIVECCVSGNPDNKDIFSKGSAAFIRTDIQFKPLSMGYFEILSRLKNMKCGELNIEYLSKQISSSKCCTLIQFRDDSLREIHTILSFSFNDNKNCVEIETFCCDGVGGGTLFNFVINAVKCGISKCTAKYDNKITLSALNEAVPFYYKYDFKYIKTIAGLDVLEKILSVPVEINIDNAKEVEEITQRINAYYFLRPNPRKKYPVNYLKKWKRSASKIDNEIIDPNYYPDKLDERPRRTRSMSQPIRNKGIRLTRSRSRSRDRTNQTQIIRTRSRHGGTHKTRKLNTNE